MTSRDARKRVDEARQRRVDQQLAKFREATDDSSERLKALGRGFNELGKAAVLFATNASAAATVAQAQEKEAAMKGSESLEASERNLETMFEDSKVTEITQGWEIAVTSALGRGRVWVDQAAERIYVSRDDWKFLRNLATLDDLVNDLSSKSGGVRLVMDAGKYRDEALARMREEDSKHAPDRLQSVRERASGLLTQAASLNTQATPKQIEIFSTRLGDLYSELEALESELEEVRGLVGTAATAVMDASEA